LDSGSADWTLGPTTWVRGRLAAFAAAGITTFRAEPDGTTADEKLATLARFMDLVREKDSADDGSGSKGGTDA
jgi:hypothetical protein